MHHNVPTRSGQDPAPHIEVWNDLVSARDLVLSLTVCGLCSVGALVLATLTSGHLLFWGLGGCVLGFALSCVLVTPKREVSIVEADGVEPDAGTTEIDADSAQDGSADVEPVGSAQDEEETR